MTVDTAQRLAADDDAGDRAVFRQAPRVDHEGNQTAARLPIDAADHIAAQGPVQSKAIHRKRRGFIETRAPLPDLGFEAAEAAAGEVEPPVPAPEGEEPAIPAHPDVGGR